MDQNYKKIIDYIKVNNFKLQQLSLVFQILLTKEENNGQRNSIIRKFNKYTKKMNINDVTKPIRSPSGYLILKLMIKNYKEI